MSGFKEYLTKAMKYCSRREVCSFDIKQKLIAWKADEIIIDEVLEQLQKEKFIDDLRFARAFVTDKFRFNKWGRRKIFFELKNKKRIPEHFIKQAIEEEIDEQEYLMLLESIAENKFREIEKKENDKIKQKSKLFAYLQNKGFEQDLIWQTISKLVQ